MYSTRARLAILRAQIATLRWQIAMLVPNDSRREALYRALLTRYHESFTLYGAIGQANRQLSTMDELIAESDRLKQAAHQAIKASEDAQRLLADLYRLSEESIARAMTLICTQL